MVKCMLQKNPIFILREFMKKKNIGGIYNILAIRMRNRNK